MTKSGNTNVQNGAKDKALDSPLYKLVRKTWRIFDEEITSPVSLKDEDIVRYVLWCIEGIKGGEDNPSQNCLDLRRSIVNLFRDSEYPPEVNRPLSNMICAYVIVCLDCAFLYSRRNDIYRLCSIAQNSIREDYKQNVSDCKEKIKCKILQAGLSSELGIWCTEHLLNEVFLTEEDAKWTAPQKDSSKKPKDKQDESKIDRTPYVLKYVCSDETTRTNRLQRAMILMQNWNWIEEPNPADDFYDFFAGKARNCNLKWKTGPSGSNSTVLTFLLQTLQKQKYFEKQPKASVRSIVRNQFGLIENYNFQERLTSDDKQRIAILLVVLDPKVTFKDLPSRGHGDGPDYSLEMMNSIYQKELHVVKDLNKLYD